MEIESINSEKFNVNEQLEKFNQLSGHMLACGPCIKSRQMQFDVCPISAMKDMLKLVEESDRVLTF
ncbi:MAG TPA: DsrE family protein [Nitrososphaeraceae archaeon]|nr:DsrE family protein [Nitrososphaeraceae archaeon]